MIDSPNNPGLSRDFIVRSVLKLWDEAIADKKYGELVFTAHFQKGEPKYISPYFKPTITEEK